jgi:hypothetical protein
MASEIPQVLAELPDDAMVTVSVRVGDWLRAREAKSGGPEILTTTQASRAFGYEAEAWRRWAVQGRIDGAWQDSEGGAWHLPRRACQGHLRSLRRRGEKLRQADPSVTPIAARLPRGPRKTTQATRPQAS